MKFACWNCRGALVEGPTLSYISYLIRLYELDVTFLQETFCKVQELVPIFSRFGLTNSSGVDVK